jgi:hypothetical protein
LDLIQRNERDFKVPQLELRLHRSHLADLEHCMGKLLKIVYHHKDRRHLGNVHCETSLVVMQCSAHRLKYHQAILRH